MPFLANLTFKIVTLAMSRDIAVVGKPNTPTFRKSNVETIGDIQATVPRAIQQPNVPGVGFNRMFQIWLENVNFEVCASSILLER